MNVECPSCSTSFPVDPNKVPAEGVNARCSICDGVFFVEGSAREAEPAVEATVPGDDLGAAETLGTPEPGEVTFSFGESEPTFGDGETSIELDPPGFDALPEAPPEPEVSFADEPEAEEAELPEPEVSTADEPEAPVDSGPILTDLPTPTFGKRDPKEKAQRLARVLVSDIILYNPDRHQKALNEDRIKEEFAEEIEKSVSEYVEQVGEEIANENNFLNEALNEILAKGQQLF